MSALRFLSILLLSCLVAVVQAVSPDTIWAEPTVDDLHLTQCDLDPTAEAIVLQSEVNQLVDFQNDDFVLITRVHRRIQVLRSSGIDRANVTFLLPVEAPKKALGVTLTSSDDNKNCYVQHLSARCYNLVDQQVVSTSLDTTRVRHSNVAEQLVEYRFTVPDVTVGSIIDYEYTTVTSECISIEPWYAQEDIPVLKTSYTFTRPEMFTYLFEKMGDLPLEIKPTMEKRPLKLTRKTRDYTFHTTLFQATAVPPVFCNNVFCASDFRTHIRTTFKWYVCDDLEESMAVNTSWSSYASALTKQPEWGRRIFSHSPYRNEVKSLGIAKIASREQRATAVWQLLMQKIRWNGQYDLYPSSDVDTVRVGNNADVNMQLIRMLRDAGLQAWPVLVRMRSLGQLSVTYYQPGDVNTFVVALLLDDDTYVYLDASSQHGYFSAMDPQVMALSGLLVNQNGTTEWVNLQRFNGNNLTHQINASIDTDGTISGHIQEVYRLGTARLFREQFSHVRDSAQWVSQQGIARDMDITNYRMTGHRGFGHSVDVGYDFQQQAMVSGGRIYLPALIVPQEVQYTLPDSLHAMPVEFPFAETEKIVVRLQLPQGYTVQQLPSNIALTNEAGTIRLVCQYTLQDDVLQVNYHLNIRYMVFQSGQYDAVRQILHTAAQQATTLITLVPQPQP